MSWAGPGFIVMVGEIQRLQRRCLPGKDGINSTELDGSAVDGNIIHTVLQKDGMHGDLTNQPLYSQQDQYECFSGTAEVFL